MIIGYTLGATIGQGSFGKVKKATDTHRNKLVAVKLVNGRNFKRHEYEQFMNEIDVMTDIVHPNSIQLYSVYEYEPHMFAMIMELAEGGELFERIQSKGSFTEEEAAGIMRQLLSCLKFMHSPERKIAHRDLKPENILFIAQTDDSCVKLTDYGFSKRVMADVNNMHGGCDHVFKTRLGSPNYVAPEILSSRHAPYGVEVDIWSLGVILYIMLCGYFPFYSENERELYKQIRSARYDFPEEEWSHVSDAAKDLVTSMLTLDPRLRATAADCLRHPWIANPRMPSRVPFPQKSLDRLRIFVEENTKRQGRKQNSNAANATAAAIPADLQAQHHQRTSGGHTGSTTKPSTTYKDKYKNVVDRIIAHNRSGGGGARPARDAHYDVRHAMDERRGAVGAAGTNAIYPTEHMHGADAEYYFPPTMFDAESVETTTLGSMHHAGKFGSPSSGMDYVDEVTYKRRSQDYPDNTRNAAARMRAVAMSSSTEHFLARRGGGGGGGAAPVNCGCTLQ